MRHSRYLAAWLLSCACVALPAQAETLLDALRAANSTNPQLGVQRAQSEIAQEQLVAAKGARLPVVEFNGQYGPERVTTNRTVVLDVGGRQIASASLQAVQPIYAGGRILAEIRSARAGIDASNAELEVVRQDTFLQTVTAYVDVQRDRETLIIRQGSVDLLDEQYRAAQDRFDVGEITRTDVALAEARLESARANYALAESQIEGSAATYAFLVGFEPGKLETAPELVGLPQTFEEALELALANSPDIRAAEHNERVAKEQIATARSRLRPEVNVIGSAGIQGTLNQPDTPASLFGPGGATPDFSDRSISAFAQARVPLYQGGVARSQVRSAKLQRSQARLQIETVRRQTVAQIGTSWHAYRAATIGIEASKRGVIAAEVAYQGGIEELAVGVRTTLDVLDQEQDLLEARLAVIEAERDAYVAAHQLLRAMGQLNVVRLGL